MNPLRSLCLMACLLAVACATPNHHQQHQSSKENSKENYANSLKPSEWLSAATLQSIPSVDEVTLQRLENMPMEKGAKLVQQLYHLSQINHDLKPSFVPSASNIPAYIMKSNGQNVSVNLNTLVATAKQQQNFGDEEVTVFITGLPQQTETIRKANKKLVQAYMQRYNGKQQQPQKNQDYENSKQTERTSSEEDYSESWKSWKSTTGDLLVIDLGAALNSFKRIAMLDVDQTGAMIGKVLVQLTKEADVPQEIIHIVAQGIAAHVAGAAGRQYTRATGQQLRRITALDPSKILARDPKHLSGLARGDAEFVDAIHTSAYGMGTKKRVGDIDFYPNGPSAGVPGAKNIVEAAMRATRYYAESVQWGNERNFPAVAANSWDQYKNNNGQGKRAYMGIATQFDQEGDYILEVNANSPFGKRTPAQKQNTYHGVHKSWKQQSSNEQ